MPVITLTTDFGSDSPYVAQMKGVILGICRAAHIVDITHAIQAQNIREAAWILGDVVGAFPAETIHVVVVDPGVGSSRKIVCASAGEATFVAPDNGVLTRVIADQPMNFAVELAERRFWRNDLSATFHGRDIMAPVAAHLANGTLPEELGSPLTQLHQLDWPKPQAGRNEILGQVMYVDSFGNLVTNICRGDLADVVDLSRAGVVYRGHTELGIVRCYAEAPPLSLVALLGSGNQLEIATVNGSAAHSVGGQIGDIVRVWW